MELLGFGPWALCSKGFVLLLTITWLGFESPQWTTNNHRTTASSVPNDSYQNLSHAESSTRNAHALKKAAILSESSTVRSTVPESSNMGATESEIETGTSSQMTRTVLSSGTIYEQKYGYSRAVRTGNQIFVSGTVAVGPQGVVGVGDAQVQARFAFEKIRSALEELGSGLDDIVRTRIYVSDRIHSLPVAEVHGELFADSIRPSNTLLIAALVEEEYLVEIEADAIVGSAML